MYRIRLQVHAYTLPLIQPWRSSKGNYTTRTGWLVMLTNEAGITGYGDCCPMPEAGTETHVQANDFLRGLSSRFASHTGIGKKLADWPAQQQSDGLPLLVGLKPALEQHQASHPAVCCAVSTALLDMQAREQSLPLGQSLNNRSSTEVSLNAAPGGLPDIDNATLQQLHRSGFRVIKLKVGIAEPAAELTRLYHIAQQLKPSALLRLDANQAWNPRQAAYFIDGIQGFPVESLEEPLRVPDLAGLEKLQGRTSIALAIDESLTDLGTQAVIQSGGLRRLVLKPMVLGGLLPALATAEQAQQSGMECVVTSVVESAAGIWADSQLASAIEPFFPGLAHGLATSHWLNANTGKPPVIIDGKMKLPRTAGSGFSPYAQYSH